MTIKAQDIEQATAFYKMPKVLFTSSVYSDLSGNAKLMYMLLFDRLDLSVKNNWLDEQGQVYQFYTIEQFMLDLNCSRQTVLNLKKELADKGLLLEVRQGRNKPNRLYLGSLNFSVRKSKNLTSGSLKTRLLEVYKLDAIKTDINKTDISRLIEQEEAAAKNPIFEKLKSAFGEMAVSGTMVSEVEDLLKTHGQDLLLHALDETILNAGKTIKYTRAILTNWQGQGFKTVEQVKQSKSDYKKTNRQETKPPEFDHFPEVPF